MKTLILLALVKELSHLDARVLMMMTTRFLEHQDQGPWPLFDRHIGVITEDDGTEVLKVSFGPNRPLQTIATIGTGHDGQKFLQYEGRLVDALKVTDKDIIGWLLEGFTGPMACCFSVSTSWCGAWIDGAVVPEALTITGLIDTGSDYWDNPADVPQIPATIGIEGNTVVLRNAERTILNIHLVTDVPWTELGTLTDEGRAFIQHLEDEFTRKNPVAQRNLVETGPVSTPSL